MIDLKDEKQKYYYLNKCISRKSIDFYGFYLYPPIVGYIFDIGEDSYRELLTPFILSNEYLRLPNSVNLFEDVLLPDVNTASLVIKSLMYFMKLKNNEIKLINNGGKYGIELKENLVIDEEKFNELKILIQMMCNVKELNKDDIDNGNEENISEKKRKLLERRRKSKTGNVEEKRVKLINVYNYIVHKPPMPDYDRYLDWSIYQLYNTYTNMIEKENVQFVYDVITSGMGTKDMKLQSYAEKIIK